VTANGNFVSQNVTFDVTKEEFEIYLKNDSHFICNFKTFGDASLSSYNLSLSFYSIEGIILLTQFNSQGKISFKKEKIYLPTIYGPKQGGFDIGPLRYSLELPTKFYSNYSYSLKLFDRGFYYDLKIVNQTDDSFYARISDVSNHFSIWNYVIKKMRVDLFSNNVQMISLDYSFNFYSISLESISPSYLIPKNRRIELEFMTKELWNHFQNIRIQYKNNFNETIIEMCERISHPNKVKCYSPSWNKVCDVELSFSIENGNFVTMEKKLELYEVFPQFLSISPLVITSVTEMIKIEGNSFIKNSTVKIKFYNSQMKQVITSQLENDERTIFSSIPSAFFSGNVLYPFVLDVDVSFDNGITYYSTNLHVKIFSVSMNLNS
jgi:hypothetical protein